MSAIGFISLQPGLRLDLQTNAQTDRESHRARLLESIERCIAQHACERVYLLSPAASTELAPRDSQSEEDRDEAARLLELALRGSPEEIEALLEARRLSRLLRQTFFVPPPPTKTIELLREKLILLTAEKRALDEEDIVNAHAVLFGDSAEPFVKLFGPRLFASPGTMQGAYGVLSCDARGILEVKIYSHAGALLAHGSSEASSARFSILS